jgi:hypothetical protein
MSENAANAPSLELELSIAPAFPSSSRPAGARRACRPLPPRRVPPASLPGAAMEGAALGALERKLAALDYDVPAEGLPASAGPLLQQVRAALRTRRATCVVLRAGCGVGSGELRARGGADCVLSTAGCAFVRRLFFCACVCSCCAT